MGGDWAQYLHANPTPSPPPHFDRLWSRGPILVRTRPQRRGGTPPPSLQTPQWLYRTMGFVGAGDFVLGIWQGEIFLFDPICLYSRYSEFLWRVQKWLKSTKKDFDPDPASGSDLG